VRVVTVEGGMLALPGGLTRADVVIRGEHIAALTSDASTIDADERIDAANLLVMPGAIDVHTHFEEPDPNLLEGFATGGMAAAAGGITTVVEMPQAHPTTFDADLLAEKQELVCRNAIVDMALWGGVTLQNGQTADDLRAMAAGGIAAFKSFMASSSPFFPAVTSAHLRDAMEVIAPLGLPYGLHAEDDALMQSGLARLQAAGRKDPLAHAESRPPIVETVAVGVALALAQETGCPVHICHVASAGALRLIADAKRRGVAVTCETCPQYLVLSTDDLVRLAGFGRCAPALREPAEVEAIWTYLLDGTIDLVASDHCGYTIESKRPGADDIFAVPLGLQGIQTMLPAVWTAAVARGMTPERFVDLFSRNPARVFGLDDRKGSLAPGMDADLAMFDPNAEWTVTVDDGLSRQPWTPYEGMPIRGRVRRTLRRGDTIYDDRLRGAARVPAEPGSGALLRLRRDGLPGAGFAAAPIDDDRVDADAWRGEGDLPARDVARLQRHGRQRLLHRRAGCRRIGRFGDRVHRLKIGRADLLGAIGRVGDLHVQHQRRAVPFRIGDFHPHRTVDHVAHFRGIVDRAGLDRREQLVVVHRVRRSAARHDEPRRDDRDNQSNDERTRRAPIQARAAGFFDHACSDGERFEDRI
jgi:allantoinase